MNPVQSSRSKLTTCLRKGRLVRSNLNSTATSKGAHKSLETMSYYCLVWFWMDRKFAAQSVANEMRPVLLQARNRRLLRFELNITATSDGGAQMLGNDVWYNSESIATKVCSQIGCKWNVIFKGHVVTTDQDKADKLRFSIWWFFEQYFFINSHVLCY